MLVLKDKILINIKRKISVSLVLVLAGLMGVTSASYFNNANAYAYTLLDSKLSTKRISQHMQPLFLIAQGHSTYDNIYSVFGDGNLQTPDCAHDEFGPHITEEWDNVLGKYAFVFHIHAEEDNDQCIRSDRQRTEIKASTSSPETLKGFLGDTVAYKWLFKLDEDFRPIRQFTHIHQIKPFPSNDLGPTITVSPVSGEIDRLEVRHRDSSRDRRVIASAPLDLFKGKWIEVSERLTYGPNGKYKIEFRGLKSGKLILKHKDRDIDLWPQGIQFHRPKWGIYRSLRDKEELLRDEQVLFDQICMVKGRKTCSYLDAPELK